MFYKNLKLQSFDQETLTLKTIFILIWYQIIKKRIYPPEVYTSSYKTLCSHEAEVSKGYSGIVTSMQTYACLVATVAVCEHVLLVPVCLHCFSIFRTLSVASPAKYYILYNMVCSMKSWLYKKESLVRMATNSQWHFM